MQKPSTFAERLKTALDYRQMTKAELSRLTGISKSSLTRYVKGDWEGKQDAVYAIANVLDVSESWLMGYDVPMERNDQAKSMEFTIPMSEIQEYLKRSDEVRKLLGTTNNALSLHICEGDSSKLSVLYYNALDHHVARDLASVIETMEELDAPQAHKVMLLLHAYLQAEQPIRDIVDTALRPYTEKVEYDLYES